MRWISGGCFAAALALAVSLGGQTIDYTWGPALLALAAALLTACGGASALRERGKGTWIALAFLFLAWGWILWRCWGSPVRDFARSDALLAGGTMAACFWGLLVSPKGAAVRLVMIALTLLGLADLGIGLHQLRDPGFAWPFASRPQVFPSGLFGHYNHLADFSLVSAALLAARFFFAGDSLPERISHALGVLAAVACVFMSGSRGGMISLCVAAVVLIALSALVAWRDKSKRRGLIGIAALAMPVIAIIIAVPVLNRFQERRGIENGTLDQFADNRSRLTSYGMAVDISANHPLAGGGSRSFGWQKYAAWKPQETGLIPSNDDFVHNELLQVATDYGWGGALLVSGALLATILCSVAGLLSIDPARVPRGSCDALMCGGLAAMAGTLVHSNFSFVTHTIPGAIYLGLAIGFALPRRAGEGYEWFSFRATSLAAVLLLPLVALSGYAGYRGSMAYRELWPVMYGKERLRRFAPGLAAERMRNALEVWPGSELSGGAGHLAREAALRKGLPADESKDWFSRAADLYADACQRNPFDPEWPLNRANVLSSLGRNNEADRAYEDAIRLQGGMEGSFRARYYFARHLFNRWYQAWTTKQGTPGQALAGLLRARDLLKEAAPLTEFHVRVREEPALLKGVEDIITFFEEARVTPEPAR
ncbi:O-antigen ligase family protein [Luteolibacter sp. Populi]|uniref:O-antigen ligase family protein n=1 Tax=Luteolibacter sp. Populi TaxID=3230487 RepID=UPI003466F292